MISTGQILAAGTITAVGVAIGAGLLRWRIQWLLVASIGAFALIVAWRALSNVLGLNGDFVPAVSVADTGCLLVGALAPAIVAMTAKVPSRLRWTPALAGGLVGFVVNVVIL